MYQVYKMNPLLCISLLFLCTPAIAEVDDVQEGAALDYAVQYPTTHQFSDLQLAGHRVRNLFSDVSDKG
jgi:hypothetical protein